MEILSPASNMKHIEVAIDAKANAVYGGLKKWNARNKAINFTPEEYNELIIKLHKNKIKFYLTLNILMLDDEINDVIDFLKNNTLPDAFIVTDIGLIQVLKKEFPQVPLHFSTQFGAHNSDDVNYIESLGGSRAILARELTLSEIKKIESESHIELECFIWGSQCLSFSGLCFFGTLINGGGGNRGKCIITCRDIYSVNGEKGHYLYVPDMNCINLISKLDKIDCLKLEGRRRKSEEIKKVIEEIRSGKKQENDRGYLYGLNISDNNLYEKINSRVKPHMLAKNMDKIDENDVLIEYKDNIPEKFSNDIDNPNVGYMYTEIKKNYDINKKNIYLDLTVEGNLVKEIIYLNYKGDGHTFISNNDDVIEFDVRKFIHEIETANENINIYKVKYQKNNSKKLCISKKCFLEMQNYILDDCKNRDINIKNQNIHNKLNELYLETSNLDIIKKYKDDSFVKIIYNISTINDLLHIDDIISVYGDSIIYKLPLFNWKNIDIIDCLKKLENKDVMFTRLSQIYKAKSINFRKKYVDYTIYVWNKESIKYLVENGVEEFTASPELSYLKNIEIFCNIPTQIIIGGKLPLVYTRNCFKHLFNCNNCKSNMCNRKEIRNDDKSLNFEIFCNDDYRYILNKEPMLNDYSNIELHKNIRFRFIPNGFSNEEIDKSILAFKNDNYYEELKKIPIWKNSYECNLNEGKE